MSSIINIKVILSEIEKEMNELPRAQRKKLSNLVYKLGNFYLAPRNNEFIKGEKYFAFILKTSFWKATVTINLRCSRDVSSNPDNYKIYTEDVSLEIFDVESLAKIKYFLESFK